MKTSTIKNTIELDAVKVDETDGLALNDNSKLLARLTEVLSVLSKNDALIIFFMAEEGIRSELDTPTKIGLTKKQYYTRLKQLVDLGLVEKRNESYTQTAFGKIVYQTHILGLVDNIKNTKYLQMVDVLKANPKFNDKDIMEFISKVKPQISHDLLNPDKKIFTVASTHEEMVEKILGMVEFSQSDILLITRFQNDYVVNAILKKAAAGVNVKVLADTSIVENYFKNEALIKSDKSKDERENFVGNPHHPSKIDRRYGQVPFCVIVVDNKLVGLEIVDPSESKKFKIAIFAKDKIIASSMTILFNNLWQSSQNYLTRVINSA